MNANLPHVIFGTGPSGYGIQSESGNLSGDERSRLLDFCRTVSWSPEKLDHPDFRAVCLLPTGDRAWLCIIEEGIPDKFDRGLSIAVKATLVGPSLELINEAITDSVKQLDIAIPSIKELPSSNSIPFLVYDPKLLRCTAMSQDSMKYSGSQPTVRPLGKTPQKQPRTPVQQSQRTPPREKSSIGMAIRMFGIGAIITATTMYLFLITPLNNQLEDVSTTLGKTFLSDDEEVTPATILQAHEAHAQKLKVSAAAIKEFRLTAASALGQPDDLKPKVITTPQDLQLAIAGLKSNYQDKKKTALAKQEATLLADIERSSTIKNDLSRFQNFRLNEAMKQLVRLKSDITAIDGKTPYGEVMQKIRLLREPLDNSLKSLAQLQDPAKKRSPQPIPRTSPPKSNKQDLRSKFNE